MVEADETQHDRLRVQDPGQHGPEPPRPHRLRARLLGQAHARHEGQAGAHRQADERCNAPQFFFAQDRALADEAYAGDVVGIPNHGTLRIGDTLTEGEDIVFRGVPSFAPEILRRVRLRRRDEGEEAAARRCSRWPRRASCSCSVRTTARRRMVGVVGALQLDVLAERLAGRIRPADRLRADRASRSAAGSRARTRSSSTASSTPHGSSHRPRSRRRPGVHGAQRVPAPLRRRSAGRRSPSPT